MSRSYDYAISDHDVGGWDYDDNGTHDKIRKMLYGGIKIHKSIIYVCNKFT